MPNFKKNTSPAMYKKSGFKMKGYSYPGTSPVTKKSGLGATAAKEFDVDDLADLKEQNKAKKAELLKQYRAKKISEKEYHQKVDEMKTYENPE
jgi:hypothetical protein